MVVMGLHEHLMSFNGIIIRKLNTLLGLPWFLPPQAQSMSTSSPTSRLPADLQSVAPRPMAKPSGEGLKWWFNSD